ncbi:Putative transposon Ty5-1 protein YCL074W, partial [Durusdinium trenchii]
VPRPTALPRAYQPNRVIGLDLFYVPSPGGGKQTTPVLNIIDWGTNYQMCELLEGKNPAEIWGAYLSTWARTFGHPEVITCDAGREFLGEFIQRASSEGIVVHQIASKAPWQQGKTERHGGHFKDLLNKVRSEVVVQSPEDLKRVMAEVEMTKNRYSNRSGFAPVQRQIGQWPRLPTSIMSDEAVDPTLLGGVLTDDLEKLHHMRRVAQKAFCEHNAKNTYQRSMRARPRTWTSYQPGEYVFVFRAPRLKKRKHGAAVDDMSLSTKARWVGPGVVITPDGANLWVAMMGELWKVAREQCRPATNDEKTGIEVVLRECEELIEEFKRGSHRRGYKGLTGEELPPGEGAELDEPEDHPGRRAGVKFEPGDEELDYVPTSPEGTPRAHEEEEARPKRRRSVIEPEQEMVPSSAEEEEKDMKNPAFPEGVPETPPVSRAGEEAALPHEHPDPAIRAAMRTSIEQANRLDGMRTDGASSGPIYRWQQRSGLHDHLAPYYEEKQWFLADEEEVEEGRLRRFRALQRPSREKDFWVVDLSAGQVLRHHLRKRKTLFDPRLNRDLPIPLDMLKEVRTTAGRSPITRTVEDDWTTATPKAEETWWKGVTTFYIKNIEEVTTYLAEKKGQDEVNLKTESAQALEEWKQADLSEWNKVTQSGAKVLGLEESQRIRRELQEQGKGDRILPTKIARRYKPGEQPGEPATKKSRLCIRGDLDPDILELERFVPTLNIVNFNIMLQVAANENMTATVGDLKNAFCQNQPLHRPNGPLYFQQPKEGVIGLHPDQIVQIVAGCYGLVDAPLHWRKSLMEDLKALGYEMSALDPCIMKLYDKSRKRLLGAIAIEVDDLFAVGHQEHHEKMKQLRAKYTFGKYVALREEKDGCAFNGRRIRQLPDGGYLVDMQKFVEERLHPMDLEKGRKSQKKEPATPEEVSMARATCGALNWLSREGRPDASGPSSLMASKLS